MNRLFSQEINNLNPNDWIFFFDTKVVMIGIPSEIKWENEFVWNLSHIYEYKPYAIIVLKDYNEEDFIDEDGYKIPMWYEEHERRVVGVHKSGFVWSWIDDTGGPIVFSLGEELLRDLPEGIDIKDLEDMSDEEFEEYLDRLDEFFSSDDENEEDSAYE